MTYPGEDDYSWIAIETATMTPHDDECETTPDNQQYWPDWKSCRCKARREERSRKIPERPVDWPWLTGRAS